MPKQKGNVIILTGPSGVGKSTIGQRVRAMLPALRVVVTYTTREPRPHEQNGVHYNFVDTTTFLEMAHAGEFLEWAQVYQNYYGNTRASVLQETDAGKPVMMVIDTQGATTIKKQLGDQAVVIFLEPDSMVSLEKRLLGRKGADPKDVQTRLAKAKQEIRQALQFDYTVTNRDGYMDETVGRVADIIRNRIKAQGT